MARIELCVEHRSERSFPWPAPYPEMISAAWFTQMK